MTNMTKHYCTRCGDERDANCGQLNLGVRDGGIPGGQGSCGDHHEWASRFAFVSRHVPTAAQTTMAAAQAVLLEQVGDRDAFAFPAAELLAAGFSGVVVVHPAAALTALLAGLAVGVFNNVNRAPLGSPPQFETTELRLFEPQTSK